MIRKKLLSSFKAIENLMQNARRENASIQVPNLFASKMMKCTSGVASSLETSNTEFV